MPIGISEDHEELRRAVRRFVDEQCPPSAVRAAIEAPAQLPSSWDRLVDLGWLTIAVPESAGGGGAGLVELAVVVEELGRGVVPGPIVPTAAASTALGHWTGPARLAVDGHTARLVSMTDGDETVAGLDPARSLGGGAAGELVDLAPGRARDVVMLVFAAEALGIAQ
jgi:alkylation response protein AidB-like acyl-CoA dehydrogenase